MRGEEARGWDTGQHRKSAPACNDGTGRVAFEKMSEDHATPSENCCDLLDLCRLAAARVRFIALTAIAFAAVAIIATTVRGPQYAATAFLEVDDLGEVPTIEEKLRFPSLYLEASGNHAEAARDLRQRTLIKAARGSRLIAVTVSNADPAAAAREADALAGVFLEPAAIREGAVPEIDPAILPDPKAADSPQSLSEAWRTQSAEFEKLAARYDHDADHPAVKGASERLEKLRGRIAGQVEEWRRRLGFEASDPELEMDEQLNALLLRLSQIREGDESPPAAVATRDRVRLAESASVPLGPTGPRSVLIWIGALALGAFTGFLVALCGYGCGSRKND